jgi:GAF domain-containing protein
MWRGFETSCSPFRSTDPIPGSATALTTTMPPKRWKYAAWSVERYRSRYRISSDSIRRVGMRATTVRFGADLWAMLERESDRLGVSAAQFVREATILRLASLAGRRGDPEAEATIADIAAQATRRRGGDSALSKALAEPRRLAALRDAALLDTPPEESFDRLAGLAARVLNAPVALVSAVDRDRDFFKSCLGLPEPWASRREMPLTHSFCQYIVVTRQPLVVSDARQDPLLRDNLAIRAIEAIAYLGVPLTTREGQVLGALCVIDHEPRTWTSDQVQLLEDLAAAVVTEITLRRIAGAPAQLDRRVS